MRTVTPYQALWLSVAAALATIALKIGAWWVTDSVGFLSDALESLVNLLGASFALAMVAYARRPADRGHPSGHGKAEYFSSAFEGLLIGIAAIGIVLAATERFRMPQALESLSTGVALSAAATIINFLVAQVLLSAGRAHRSLATEADGHHLMTDVWTTIGVIVGVGLAGLSGWYWLDPLVAVLVAVNILREAWRLLRRSVSGLMDAALPDEDIRSIQTVLRKLEQRDGVAFEDLRTRRGGAARFATVTLRVPGAWSVQRASVLADEAERMVGAMGVTLFVQLKPHEAQGPRQ
ncbi:MAG: cation diffusion facilitator family transporter [Gammaproteobacteria bacterium]|nr:cation diffusion facilitator family transporter [Gammaproteobacteria bacterium]